MNLYTVTIIAPFGLIVGGGLFTLKKGSVVSWIGEPTETPEIRLKWNNGTIKISNFQIKGKHIAELVFNCQCVKQVHSHPTTV